MHVRSEDSAAIALALGEARAAGDAGDIPIGAVVIDGAGTVLAVAGNRRERDGDPTAHAEILALRAAAAAIGSWRLEGATLAVTLEPCAMCAGAIGIAHVARLVFGAWNPDHGAVGSVWDVLRSPQRGSHVEVVSGVRADECSALLRDFFSARRTGPHPIT